MSFIRKAFLIRSRSIDKTAPESPGQEREYTASEQAEPFAEYPGSASLPAEKDALVPCEGAEKHRKSRPCLHGQLVLALCMILTVCAVMLVFLKNYSVKILSQEGKITLSISDRARGDFDISSPAPEPPVAGKAHTAAHTRTEDDGTRLQIVVERSAQEKSVQEIYARMIDSVVCIEAVGAYTTVSASGIIMSSNGYIITNEHVIGSAQSINVTLQSGQVFTGMPVGSDTATDLAVLKIDKTDCTYAEFGDSEAIRVGDKVLAIGNPLGAKLAGTLTDGIISALNRNVEVNGYTLTLIQTNAALNDGSSGGPLINMYGQVIGINTLKSTDFDSAVEGIGFAIPIGAVKPIVDDLIEHGYIAGRPSLGFDAVNYDLPNSAVLFYGTPSGVIISSVNPKSDAGKKGIAQGDIIVSIDTEEVYSVSDLSKVKNRKAVGDEVTLVVYRKGNYYQVKITLVDEAALT